MKLGCPHNLLPIEEFHGDRVIVVTCRDLGSTLTYPRVIVQRKEALSTLSTAQSVTAVCHTIIVLA